MYLSHSNGIIQKLSNQKKEDGYNYLGYLPVSTLLINDHFLCPLDKYIDADDGTKSTVFIYQPDYCNRHIFTPMVDMFFFI